MSADFWAGYVSGAAGIIIGNPLDLVKTRLQAGTLTSSAHATTTIEGAQGLRGQFDSAGTLVKGEYLHAAQALYAWAEHAGTRNGRLTSSLIV